MTKLETSKDPTFFSQKTFSTLDFSVLLGIPITDEVNKKLNITFKNLLDYFVTPKFIESLGAVANETHKKRAMDWLKAMEHDGDALPIEVFNATKVKDCMGVRNWIKHYWNITPAEEQANDK